MRYYCSIVRGVLQRPTARTRTIYLHPAGRHTWGRTHEHKNKSDKPWGAMNMNNSSSARQSQQAPTRIMTYVRI